MFGDHPPRWLAWANTAGARATTTAVAFVALIVSALLGVRYQNYVECVADQQQRDGDRTRAVSAATDVERAADTAVLAGPRPGGPTAEELRLAAVAARKVTDQVRAQNPPPPVGRC